MLSDFRFSWDRASKPQEPLTILVPSPDAAIEPSRISREYPPAPSRAHSTWTNTATAKSSRDVEAATVPSPRLRDRFTKFFFDMRTIGRDHEPELPIQPPRLSEWPPLHIEKRTSPCFQHCTRRQKKRKRDRIMLIVLIVVILYLLGNVVALNTRTFSSTSSTSSATAASLSADQQLCLSEYNINAPANASLYPCSTCFPVLQSIPSQFSATHAQDAQQVVNALQFCALRSIFDTADVAGQSELTTGGWVLNVLFCSWSGVECDGSGQVSSL